MASVLLDTGVIVALFNNNDNYHQQSVNFIKKNKYPLITTVANVTECMFVYRHNVEVQANILMWLHLAHVEIVHLSTTDLLQIGDLITQYADVAMDFTHACILHIAHVHGVHQVATIDSDLHVYQVDNKYPFNLGI